MTDYIVDRDGTLPIEGGATHTTMSDPKSFIVDMTSELDPRIEDIVRKSSYDKNDRNKLLLSLTNKSKRSNRLAHRPSPSDSDTSHDSFRSEGGQEPSAELLFECSKDAEDTCSLRDPSEYFEMF